MKTGLYTLRRFIREELHRKLLTTEGVQRSPDELAAFVLPMGTENRAIFYDPQEFKASLGNGLEKAADKSVRGYLNLRKTFNAKKCGGADEIHGTWGPGCGDIIYGTAFVMSSGGRIMSDRSEVSPAARGWWRKNWKRFDSTELAPEDCLTYGEDESPDDVFLDRVYSAGQLTSKYEADLQVMNEKHVSAMSDVPEALGDKKAIESALHAAGLKKFLASV